ncbi:MAG: hypothetical protein GX227_02630 [Clostridiaceae bacterium]|nr:hypothetical protein [Clostridiaceae bacterium]
MEIKLKAEVVREKSFDPHFWVKVSYDDGTVKFKNELVSVSRKPPKVNIEYSETIKKYADKIDIKQIELEIMKAIVESLLGNSGKRL